MRKNGGQQDYYDIEEGQNQIMGELNTIEKIEINVE